MKELYCPAVLRPYVERACNEIDFALSNISSPPIEARTLSHTEIADSLSTFAERINNDGLDQTVKSFAKAGCLEEKFVLRAASRRDLALNNSIATGKFFVDGDYLIALGHLQEKQAEPLWIGIISFELGLPSSHYIVKETGFTAPLPLIVQVQGAARWSYDTDEKYTNAQEVLARLKWEKALVTVLFRWAEENSIPAVYLLPSSLNLYYHDGTEDRDVRLHMRYDVTAKRMGFKLQTNGLYRALIDVSSTRNGDIPN